MPLFTFKYGRRFPLILLLWIAFGLSGHPARAQAVTNSDSVPSIPDPTALETPGASARTFDTNAVAAPSPGSIPASIPALEPPGPPISGPAQLVLSAPPAESSRDPESTPAAGDTLIGALLALASLGGFVLYQCGLTRAKNCAHTSTLLLLGTIFALAGYWMGGFAVQTGGIGDAHAALPVPSALQERSALDHELGFMAAGHHWGLMGSAGFFLNADDTTRGGMASLFLIQAVGLLIAVSATLGASLERGRIVAMAVLSFLIGAGIYPLVANWIWGGGWLAALGRGFGLGHGVVDLAGAGVIHETAGTLALVVALVLGPRHGRFDRIKGANIPGHNVPFIILGGLVLLLAWTSSNAFAYAVGSDANGMPISVEESTMSLAATNVLLGAMGGTLISVFLSAWRRQRSGPSRLMRGLLGGAVALSGGSAFFDPWAAVLVGVVGGSLVDTAVLILERRRIDDPTGATAVHGVAGAWGLLAVGIFANGAAGRGVNGVDGPVRGLLFGGASHQLAAQALGGAVIFGGAFLLGGAVVLLVQKVLGNRVRLADEIQGLDWPQVGALGYQPDVEAEEADPLA